ncbi:MgtC/SapB family protein [Senegalia massiliensis]|uniref:MgtC/SapB family protein n=1 Tax=Senegalia massiliensis TaxID=1720316 RepID=A0A845QY50_9CLOT|nr:MgtC/SapB family protein [Senegalia massiliensis]NBI07897.1 MgtC/SapB family protein [Senegalia massiliensis]
MEIALKLVISIILSGIIGIERESIKRPAGFRTHILVCVGSTLVMIVGLYISDDLRYSNVDPTRIGAQVISGIGFLGAGTIIKEGVSVKGLTTAASLWAVACVGLAIGAGFYFGAILVTFLIFITLLLFSSVENKFLRNDKYLKIRLVTINKPGQLGKIGQVTGNLDLTIVSIDFNNIEDNKIIVNLLLKSNKKTDNVEVISELSQIKDVIKITHK